MLNRLNTKERILIISLLTIIIWAIGIMFIIKPNVESNSETQDKLEVAEQNKVDVDTKLASETALKESITNTKAEMYETLEAFFPATENYDVDQYIMNIWQKSGLKIKSVTIAEPTVSTLDYYSYNKSELSYPLGDYAKTQRSGEAVGALVSSDETSESTDTELGDSEQTNELCEITTVGLSVEGSQDQIRNFIDSVNHNEKTLLVKSVSANNNDGTWQATITIDFIAVDKYE